MKRQSFLQGAFVLAAAGFGSKVLGLVYRFPLSRLILDVGMGLYGMVYPIYTLMLALSTAGVPVAISKLVSEQLVKGNVQEAKRIFKVSLISFGIIGLFLAGCLLVSARSLIAIGFVRDPRAYWGLIAIAPAIFIVSISVSFRGYFQGWRMMTPTAVSQVFEQLIRVVTALGLGYLLISYGVEFAAAGAVFGAVTGGFTALLVLLYYYSTLKRQIEQESEIILAAHPAVRGDMCPRMSGFHIFKQIISIAIPISLAGLVMPIMQNIDLAIVPGRLLKAGFSLHEMTALYGQLSQMASILVNMPTILTLALAASVVPAISEAYVEHDMATIHTRINTALRVTVFFELPAFLGYFILAKPITLMLFANGHAGEALACISAAVLFLGLHQVSSGILQGLGKPIRPLVNLLIGAIAKILLTYYLTAMPDIEIKGAALGTVAAFLIASMLNLISIVFVSKVKYDWKSCAVKIPAAAAIMAILLPFIYKGSFSITGSNSLSALLAIILGSFIYLIVLLLIGGIKEDDLLTIPKVGVKLAVLFKKIRILRS